MPHVLAEFTPQDRIVAIVAAVVVVLVAAIGWRDVSRFGFRRVRAIAGVSFRESIRRRVLWITPLAIIGVIAITQLTKPNDEQDAIRETVRYCLFASGLIVVVSAILLACTNLPKEIESRVIFTIVTKPTTRLEIVLGKVIGFAMVTGVMLLIMGAFTFAYLEVRSWSMLRSAQAELAKMEQEEKDNPGLYALTAPTTRSSSTRPALAAGDASAVELSFNRRIRKQTLQRYAQNGLLGTKAIDLPDDMQVYARDPDPTSSVRWFAGGGQTYCIAPVSLGEQDVEKIKSLVEQRNLVYLVVRLTVEPQKHPLPEEVRDLEQGTTNFPLEEEVVGPMMVGGSGASKPSYRPQISVIFRARKGGQYIARELMQGNSGTGRPQDPVPVRQPKPGMTREYRIRLATVSEDKKTFNLAPLQEFLEAGPLNVEVSGYTPTFNFGARPTAVSIMVPRNGDDFANPLLQIDNSTNEYVDGAEEASHDESKKGLRFYSRQGRTGMQLPGRPESGEDGEGTVAVYSFTGAHDIEARDGQVILETRLGVDRAGDLDPARNITTSNAEIVVHNRKTGVVSKPIYFEPQTGRTIDVQVPADAVAGGDFDVMVRGKTPGQLLSVRGLTASIPSITLVRADQSFMFNLLKSLTGLWLLSILVVTISVFCSTFLSWPIAVVLTLLLLLGRWGVEALGDSLAPGGSRSVAQDLFRIRDAAKNKAVTDTMEALSTVLRNVGPVLPDVSRFPAFEDIERGVSMPPAKLGAGGMQLLLYGIPLLMLTYLILRNKEVAP